MKQSLLIVERGKKVVDERSAAKEQGWLVKVRTEAGHGGELDGEVGEREKEKGAGRRGKKTKQR